MISFINIILGIGCSVTVECYYSDGGGRKKNVVLKHKKIITRS